MKPAETDEEDGGAGVPGDRACWGGADRGSWGMCLNLGFRGL